MVCSTNLCVGSNCQAVSTINQSHVVDLNVRLERGKLTFANVPLSNAAATCSVALHETIGAVEDKFSEFAPCGNYGSNDEGKGRLTTVEGNAQPSSRRRSTLGACNLEQLREEFVHLPLDRVYLSGGKDTARLCDPLSAACARIGQLVASNLFYLGSATRRGKTMMIGQERHTNELYPFN